MSTTTEAPAAANKLLATINDSGLTEQTSARLVQEFMPAFVAASNIIAESRSIVVTEATQLTEMKAARAARLKLKDIRVESEKARKALKEDSLRMGKAIDNVAKVIAMLTEPEEARLEEAEQFAARAEQARKHQLRTTREALLRPFGIDTTHYDLGSMPEPTFASLLDSTRIAHEARIAAAAKAEADRIAAEKAAREEQERIRAENERLRAEREAQERAAAAERAKAEAERKAIEAKHAAERKAADDKARAEREAAEAKLRAEREAREKLEREAAEKARAEAAKKAADERAAKKAAAAPDADKLRALAAAVACIPLPKMTSEAGHDAIQQIARWLDEVARRISDRADVL